MHTVFVMRRANADETWWLTDTNYTPEGLVEMLGEGEAAIKYDLEGSDDTVIMVGEKVVAVRMDSDECERYFLMSVETREEQPKTESQALAEDWRKYGPKTREEFLDRLKNLR